MNVIWLASPYRNARDARYPIRGVVNHRIVGTLLSARAAFGVAPGTSRNASTHFGIGFVSGRLTIDQFVDLSDMAWGNGDAREPTWPFYQAGVNPNLTTVSIEHEDGGSAGRGVVKEPIWQASMELQKLITSGDLTRIRTAGIRVRDAATVTQLAAIPKDARGFIDHHQIAGPNKPYCFRRWLDDPGFVEGFPSRRDRLLAHLRAAEDDMTWKPVQEDWDAPDGHPFTDGDGNTKAFDGMNRVRSIAESGDGGAYRLLRYGTELLVTPRKDLVAVPGSRVPAKGYGFPPVDGVPAAQVEQAKRLEFGRGRDEAIAAYTAAGTEAARAVTP